MEKKRKLTLFHLPLGWCLFKNENRKLLSTIPIPLELTTLKLARSKIINMAIWWLCYYAWEGGGEGGLVAVRPDGFSWCGRNLWASTPHASVLCNRKNTGDHFQMQTCVHITHTHRHTHALRIHSIEWSDKQNKQLVLPPHNTPKC